MSGIDLYNATIGLCNHSLHTLLRTSKRSFLSFAAPLSGLAPAVSRCPGQGREKKIKEKKRKQ
jgi:hypothetical protein